MGNLSDVDLVNVPDSEFSALPEGDYVAIMTSAEKKPNSKGTGSYLSCAYEVIDGQYKGRKVFDNMNLWNPNQTAVDIARRELKKLCGALGFAQQPSDSAELLNKPFVMSLTVYQDTYNGKTSEKNKIADYKPAVPGQAPAVMQGGIPAGHPAAMTGATPGAAAPAPWAR